METLTKVKNVQGAGTWDSPQHGTFYKFDYDFEDGTCLRAMHKSENHFKVGDQVAYEVTKDHPEFGKSGKVKKPQLNGQPKADLKGIKIGHAINCASVLAQGRPFSTIEDCRDFIHGHAKMIYELSEYLNQEL